MKITSLSSSGFSTFVCIYMMVNFCFPCLDLYLCSQVKKKAKWIRKAMKEFREYEEKVVDFKAKRPEFNPPSVKSFLTQEEQKILDK